MEQILANLSARVKTIEDYLVSLGNTSYYRINPTDFTGEPPDEDCLICFEPLNDGRALSKACQYHIFHRECLQTFIDTDPVLARCPLCRYDTLSVEQRSRIEGYRQMDEEELQTELNTVRSSLRLESEFSSIEADFRRDVRSALRSHNTSLVKYRQLVETCTELLPQVSRSEDREVIQRTLSLLQDQIRESEASVEFFIKLRRKRRQEKRELRHHREHIIQQLSDLNEEFERRHIALPELPFRIYTDSDISDNSDDDVAVGQGRRRGSGVERNTRTRTSADSDMGGAATGGGGSASR